MIRDDFSRGVRAALPTQIGYLSIGLALGIVASDAGLSPLETFLSSVLIYSGSGQFALVSLVIAKADLAAIAVTVLLINLRHFLLNLHTSTIFNTSTLPQQILLGTFMTDESYGVLLGEYLKGKSFKAAWMHGNNLSSYLIWVLATTVGNLLGQFLPNPQALGVDFALSAMFVAIFIGQLENLARQVSLVKIAYVLGTVFLVYLLGILFVSSSLAVLLATILACLVGVLSDD